VADADIGETRWIVSANGNVARQIGHEIVDARIPLQRRLRIQVAEGGDGVGDASHAHCGKLSKACGERSVDRSCRSAEQAGHADRQLSAQHRACECVSRIEQQEIGLRMQACIQADVNCRRKPADRNLSCRGHPTKRRYSGMIVNLGHGPARHLGSCREAAEVPGKPERNAVRFRTSTRLG